MYDGHWITVSRNQVNSDVTQSRDIGLLVRGDDVTSGDQLADPATSENANINRRRIESITVVSAYARQAHSPAAAGEQCAMHSCIGTLQWVFICPRKTKSAPSPEGSGPTINAWFVGPTRVSPLNGISIGSAVFAQITHVPNTRRHTDSSGVTLHVPGRPPHKKISFITF